MKKNFLKIVSIVLTMLMLVGTMTIIVPLTASAEEAEPIYLEKNTTATINGITYRFDTNTSKNPDSWARVNPDGTWEVKFRYGDTLWFPEVELTSDSEIHAEITVTSEEGSDSVQDESFSGLAYGILADANGRYQSEMVAAICYGSRTRTTRATYEGNHMVTDGLGGNGGYDRINKYSKNNGFNNISLWNSLTDSNGDVKTGSTVTFDVFKNDGTVSVTYGSQGQKFVTTTYSNTTSFENNTTEPRPYEGGAVGISNVYTKTSGEYTFYRLEELVVRNCKVDDENGGFSIYGDVVKPHTNFEIDGKVYRFDPLEGSTKSMCVIKPDGTLRLMFTSGDLLWMPDTQNIDGAFVSAKMIANNNLLNNGNLAAGLAYDIELGENGTWGDDSDSLINAHTQTSWRRRICSTSVAEREGTCVKLGVQSGNTLEEVNRNEAYLAWGNRWECGKILNYSLAINEAGNCYVSFMDENNVEMTYDYYGFDESARKVLDGPIGFYAFWSGDNNDRGYMTVEILEMTAIKESAPVYGVTDAAISLSLDGTIGLNFAFNADGGVPAGSTIVATKNGVVVAEQAVVEGANLVTAPVAAKEMNDSVNFSIVSEGEVFDSHSYTTSVAEYAALLMADDNYNEWDELIDAMLNYGAAAQMLFNYKTDALAGNISAIDYDFSSYEAIVFNGNTSVLAGLYMNLSLESDTTLKLYIMMADGTKPTVSVNGEAAELVDNGDGYWVLSIGDIAADKLDDDFAIVVNGGAVSFAVNALDWAKIASADADVNVANVAKALAAYGVAAGKKF